MAQDGRGTYAQPGSAMPASEGNGNGLGRRRVGEIQRTRILLAMAEVASELGIANISVAHVVERAGVSRRTFYELFEDCEDCFLAAFREAIDRASCYVSAEYDPTEKWTERVRSALEALLRFLDSEPALGRVAVIESLGAGTKALDVRRDIVARMVMAVDAGRLESEFDSSITALTAEGIVGGVLSVIHGRLVEGEGRGLSKLVNPLMSMIVLPYLGSQAASKELRYPTAKVSTSDDPVSVNPLKGLEMRLTYRTVRVMAAIAANQGASNRVIGDASGVGDQGQISKLLARLQRLGLVENARVDPSKGAPNAWMLTKQGEEVADVIATGATRS
jgi:AcrR family transcriptional regulator/DNA-binding MarR family transcriptional regulator